MADYDRSIFGQQGINVVRPQINDYYIIGALLWFNTVKWNSLSKV